jgi:hypothetical protein
MARKGCLVQVRVVVAWLHFGGLHLLEFAVMNQHLPLPPSML